MANPIWNHILETEESAVILEFDERALARMEAGSEDEDEDDPDSDDDIEKAGGAPDPGESSANREALETSGDIGLPEAATEEQIARDDGSDDHDNLYTGDMKSKGNTESGDEGVPGGLYAADERTPKELGETDQHANSK